MTRRRLGSWLRRGRARGSDEQGVVLALVAIMLVFMLGMAALAIDLGSFYKAQRQAQSAADAGALAGAQDIAANPTGITTDANKIATTNYPGATPTVSQPTSTSVKVTVSASTPAFFGQIFGITSANVSASATASQTSTTSPCTSSGQTCYAVFAMDSSCSDNGFTGGGGIHLNGGTHSNGSLNVGGGGSSFGYTSYGTGCTLSPASWNQNNNTFTPAANDPASTAPVLTWPIDYTQDFPPCTGAGCTGPCANGAGTCTTALHTPSFCTKASNSTSTWALDTYTRPYTLVSNQVYCDVGSGDPNTPSSWNGTVQASGGPVESSFVAGKISFGGGTHLTACGYSLTAYDSTNCNAPTPPTGNYPVAYATGTGTAVDDGSGGCTFTGDMFVPNGQITIGGGVTVTSFLEAQQISMSAGGITGDGPQYSGSTSSSGTTSESLTQ